MLPDDSIRSSVRAISISNSEICETICKTKLLLSRLELKRTSFNRIKKAFGKRQTAQKNCRIALGMI